MDEERRRREIFRQCMREAGHGVQPETALRKEIHADKTAPNYFHPDEIDLKFLKVYYEEATMKGFDPVNIKYFPREKLKSAKRYAEKLVEDILTPSAAKSDDYNGVLIENEAGEVVDVWRAEDGKVVHYPGGM